MTTRQRGSKLNSDQREQKMQEAWLMRQAGNNQYVIAEALDIDQALVSRMLKAIRLRLAKRFEEEVVHLRIEQSEQLDYIQQRAMTAFNKSERDSEMTRTVSGRDGEVVTEETKGQAGNAKFLQVAIQAINLKAELHGTKAPKKTEVSGIDGGAIVITSGDMLDAERELNEWRNKMKDGSNLDSLLNFAQNLPA